jgi:hippurate hydrolase
MGPIEHLRNDHAALTALRRDLHAHPELGFEEHRTVEVVTRELSALGVGTIPASARLELSA